MQFTDMSFRLLRGFRWILLVFYIGLGIGLAIYAAAYLVKLASFATTALDSDPLFNALAVLNLIDGALIGGLTVMVMTSSFAIFVGKPPSEANHTGPATVGFAALKTKFAATLTAIGAINLLEYALDVQHVEMNALIALCGVELVFLLVTLGFAWIEKLGSADGH